MKLSLLRGQQGVLILIQSVQLEGELSPPNLRPQGLCGPQGGESGPGLGQPTESHSVCLQGKSEEGGSQVLDYFFHLETDSISDMIAGNFHQPNERKLRFNINCKERGGVLQPLSFVKPWHWHKNSLPRKQVRVLLPSSSWRSMTTQVLPSWDRKRVALPTLQEHFPLDRPFQQLCWETCLLSLGEWPREHFLRNFGNRKPHRQTHRSSWPLRGRELLSKQRWF